MKSTINDLAIRGGAPEFEAPVHVGQLNLPTWESFETGFKGIFEREFYSNHGPLERELDARIADRLGVKHAVSITNGTIALMLAARALNVTGKVIVPSFTFPATVQCLAWAGLEPVFCDVDPERHVITAKTVEAALTPDTVAILGTHLWGHICHSEELQALARSRGLRLMYDAAHAFGASDGNTMAGGFGDLEVFSFHATKVLNATEGGCITTNDDDLAARVRTMRSFHETETYAQVPVRMNGKMSEAQACMALISLDELDVNIRHNKTLTNAYWKRIVEIPGLRLIDCAKQGLHNYQYLVLEVTEEAHPLNRDIIVNILKSENILAKTYFKRAVHRMEYYRDRYPEFMDTLPVTDWLSSVIFQLPIGQSLTEGDVARICNLLEFIMTNKDTLDVIES